MFSWQFPSWINFLLVSSYLVNKGAAIRCYICGGEAEDSFPCSEFQIWDEKYNKECEKNSQICQISRRVDDKIVLSRLCEIGIFTNCYTANSIEYCYCSNNLCNYISPLVAKEGLEDTEDETAEDSMEGSGTKNVNPKSTTELDLFEKTSTTKTTIKQDTVVETNVIPSDRKYSSSCIILYSNLYLPISIILLLYFLNTKQY